MATRVLFVTTQYLKDNLPIDDNLDAEIIHPIIGRAQDRYILPILGSTLYNKLINEVSAGTITGQYKLLMDTYIQPCLKEFVFADSIPFINYKFTNKSIAKKSSDNSEPASESEVDKLQQPARDMGQFYAERLTRYLWANSFYFPEFTNPDPSSDTIVPQPTQYFNGVHVPNMNWNGCGSIANGLRKFNGYYY